MKKIKMHLKCPNCSSEKIIPSKGPFIADAVFDSPKYTCEDCGYMGPLIIDDSKEKKKEEGPMSHDLEKIAKEITKETIRKKVKKETYGDVFSRFMAFIADCILIGIIFYLIYLPLSSLLFVSFNFHSKVLFGVFGISSLVIDIVIPITYFIYFTGVKGSTPGKNVFHLRVVDKNNKNIGIKKAIIREIVKFLLLVILFVLSVLITASWISPEIRILFFILDLGVITSLLIFIFDSRKQSLWDKLAGSYVVKK